jgi:hypothetical protein
MESDSIFIQFFFNKKITTFKGGGLNFCDNID